MRLYCHSTGREAKERAIGQHFSTRLEAQLQHLAEGLHQPRRVKNYEKVLTRIGRLRQRGSRVASYYDIRVVDIGPDLDAEDPPGWEPADAADAPIEIAEPLDAETGVR